MILNLKVPVIFHEEEGGFWAEVPTLPGCYSQGRTLDEARRNIVESIQGYLETLREELDLATREGRLTRVEEVTV